MLFLHLKKVFTLLFASSFFPFVTSAHENYVLSEAEIERGMRDTSLNVLDALEMPGNVKIALFVALGGFVVFLLYFFFVRSRAGTYFHRKISTLEPLGHVALRIALALSFFASAYTSSFLGPEISIFSLPFAPLVHISLYILALFLLFGWYSEIAGALGFVILLLATVVYKDHMLTYFNYFGEFLALIFFGSRIFSIDGIFRKGVKTFMRNGNLERAIIRITYGISILYPAISIKLLHPRIILDIVSQYHLDEIHWLFPSDPLLIALGTGVAQVVVGMCIVLGLFTRLNTLITFVLMVMSVVFFKEAVWPHYILLALALYLFINNGGEFGLDRFIHKRKLK